MIVYNYSPTCFFKTTSALTLQLTLEGSDPCQSERQMESFHWVNRDGMTSKVMFHVLVHVNKLAKRYYDSNFRFVELSKNTKRPHFLWVSRPKPVAKPEIMKNDKMMLNSDQSYRTTINFQLISCIYAKQHMT